MTDASSLLPALYIFSLRLVDISLYVLRINMVTRGRKRQAWVFGFFQSLVFISAISVVFKDLDDWTKVLAYGAGFATGNILGMMLEERLAIGHLHLRIITRGLGAELAEVLREQGYAVTEVPATGRRGSVSYLNCNVMRRDVREVTDIVEAIDEDAFITSQNVRPVERGFWRGGRQK